MEENMIITKADVAKFRQSIPERQSAAWSDIEVEDCLKITSRYESYYLIPACSYIAFRV